ncbi:type I restriction modification DNA specificity domain protein [Bacteroides fragilis str. S24L15]|uniref:restriction endonuclease subunit S n=1 Tax=Bacteroidaceae TaxID=815 RepID=UPI000449BA8A|nr:MULTISPECIES: restriction endonuclease subunit S [Bacteroidaceae]EYA68680.1 type I restriction modification DNA specificity domain protein [Bacteroides fragilis str. S24L15]EYA81281.1 type I restriction modification DNA specificity domain protein [Bacteroides fragilis str. S24L34]
MPFEIPDNWVWTTLEEICLFLSRGKSPKYSDTDKTYPVFAQKCNLKEGGISLEQARFLDPSTICKWSEEYKLKTGDVLVNSTGTGTVGRTRLFHESYLKNYPFVVPDSHVSVIRTTNEIKSEFVFAYISSQLIQRHLEDNLAGSTNQKELYIGVLSDLSFPLPPLAEQQRIVVEIEKWFALIDQIEQGKANLQTTIKQTKSKILDLAIHGKLVLQDPHDEPAIELLKRINPDFTPCDNGHYTQLPEGWAICKMKQITSITNGKSQKNVETLNGIYPIYGSGGVIGRANQYLCIAGSTIIGRKGTINNPIFVEEHFWNVDTAFGLKANDAILDKYLYYFCLSFDFSKLDKSTAMPSLTKTSIGNVLIPIPPYKEQERIVAKIDMVLDTMNEILRAV